MTYVQLKKMTFHPDVILQMEEHQHPGWLELLAREMTPARSTLIEKVRDTQSIKLNFEINVCRGSRL